MTKEEFEGWTAVTKSSAGRWTEDIITRLNGRGALLYKGGEDGVYIRVSPDGGLEAGSYEGAIPHIGEAFFSAEREQKYGGFDEALDAAQRITGIRLKEICEYTQSCPGQDEGISFLMMG